MNCIYENFMLICPHCKTELNLSEKSYRCENNHCFDQGKAGDLNLLLVNQKRSKSPGDSREMVNERHSFLESGAYSPIAELLAKTVMKLTQGQPKVIADAGCGEGYYLRQVQRLCFPSLDYFYDNGGQFIGWDISKFAVQKAAKSAKFPAKWLTASNAHIPLANNSVDILVSAFGFEVAEEFARVLKPNGYIVTLDAGEKHLLSLRKVIYPMIKPFREKPLLNESLFRCIKKDYTSYYTLLNKTQLSQLMIMTPHLYRATYEGKVAVQQLNELEIDVDVQLRVYQHNA
ncbi:MULTISPECIES: putative RNA methyltransferase [Pasteurellaceae]|nr:methyltransferase domain-containing protein [Pasteurella atlantica]MDP8106505.1 methyltransferase domain-containing protein [Pasteurella atlantica]